MSEFQQCCLVCRMEFFDEEYCPACYCQQHAEELEANWNAELEVYALRTDFQLDYNEFYYFCEAGEVNRMNLIGLPALQECYDDAMNNLKFYQHEDWKYANRQLELFSGDLPF